jgi:hypothetical protein
MIEVSWFDPPQRQRLFSSPERPEARGAQLASYPTDTKGSFHGDKWPEREAEGLNAWNYSSVPHILHGVGLK